MKKMSLGILAHVDAGKTTLTESLLFDTGMIRSIGRVDNGDAFLDTGDLEKKRGVTILSKQALCTLGKENELNRSSDDVRITIIDTPGHADFIGEAERVLGVLDAALLLISGPDGVTASTKRLVGMLKSYKVPYFVFVNKMDMCERPEEEILAELTESFGEGFVKYTGVRFENGTADGTSDENDFLEEIASLSEDTIEKYLETGSISYDDILNLIYSGRFHPVVFGSALKNIGVDKLVNLVTEYLPDIKYRETFAAKIFKIGYEDGHKLSFAKVTGGSIAVRSEIDDERLAGEKISQIRSYSGSRFEAVDKAEAGDVVAFVGLENAYAGMGIGGEFDEESPLAQPVLRYDLELPKDVPLRVFYPKLKELAMEDPLLKLEATDDDRVSISVMGDFQMEILKDTILSRFGVAVEFVKGSFVYKETINYPVIGYGHFEPLRHYSEVQILIEPISRGSGIEVASDLSVNDLDINWQKTIISTMTEHLPVGVLTGAELTDIRFTLIAGKAHLKHTDSQDFREAVRRAVRQGLMKTENVLLEPEYDFVITVPTESVGRVMTDVSEMGGKCEISADGTLVGNAPARLISDYQTRLTQFTSGSGSIELKFAGYRDMPEDVMLSVIEEKGYAPDSDKNNPSGSIFIDHGAGYYVPWFECEALMHLPSMESEYLGVEEESDDERLQREAEQVKLARERSGKGSLEAGLQALGTDEIDDILRSATHSNAGKENRRTKRVYLTKSTVKAETRAKKTPVDKKKYLLVDGYNIIHAWKDLKGLLEDENSTSDRQSLSLEAARFKLLDIMSEYKAMKGTEVIVVYDAYNVRGHFTEKMDYLGVHVVYTKEAETADQYIARFTVENSKNFDITVATSDGLIQLIIRGENSKMLTARQLEDDYRTLRQSLL
ncbi:MAG: TetM/TetW/TetO/TetS family tetracycline resistance ribosomal protection protein [Eubacterium sp.]|nr:TetM/TetW/TetO/TetS family tetracycline resistance ribosomal protection protein [Eubacterium sp.]